MTSSQVWPDQHGRCGHGYVFESPSREEVVELEQSCARRYVGLAELINDFLS